jgi:DNA repair protein SbcC/Rad50
MIPVRLYLKGFLSYREPVELDFTGFDLACISGANGAGKSSLLDAITYALFGQARKRDESLIHTNCDVAEVQFTFDYESNRYKILRANPRGRPSKLEFQIRTPDGGWKTYTENSLRETQARIEDTLRLDYETFVNASFFLQGKADQFTQQRPGDRKRILAGILGLSVWEDYRRQAAELRKKVEAGIAVVDGRLAEIHTELEEEETRRKALEQLEAELEQQAKLRTTQEANLENIRRLAAQIDEQKKFVSSLQNQVQEARDRLQTVQSRLETRVVERDQYAALLAQEEQIEAAYHAYQLAQQELEDWEEIAGRFRVQEQQRQAPLLEIESERARLQQEQKGLAEQAEQVAAFALSVAALTGQIVESEARVKSLEDERARQEDTEENLAAARQALAAAQAENPLLRDEMNALRERIDRLQETEGAECPLCGQPLSEHDRHSLIEHLESEGTGRGDRFRENQALIRTTSERIKELEQELAGFGGVENNLRREQRALDQLNERKRVQEEAAQAWESRGATRLAVISEALAGENFALDARLALRAVDEALKEIGYDAAEHDRVRRAVADGRVAEEQLRQLEAARAAFGQLEREIGDLEIHLGETQAVMVTMQEELAAALNALETAESQAPDVYQAERALLDIQEQENRLHQLVGGARQKVTVLADLKERKKEFSSQREGLTRQVARFKQLERAFGKDGVPALLIEQALPQIESRANELLDRLSSSGMSVRFVTQAEFKDRRRDDLRETLDIQISDSNGTRDYEMYSGGEAFRVNFAVRLALSEMLAQRAGARLQTLVIDEGFGSQDAQGRQRLIEAINLIRPDFAKILVITHIEELKDSFPVRIEVTKTSQGSQVVLA